MELFQRRLSATIQVDQELPLLMHNLELHRFSNFDLWFESWFSVELLLVNEIINCCVVNRSKGKSTPLVCVSLCLLSAFHLIRQYEQCSLKRICQHWIFHTGFIYNLFTKPYQLYQAKSILWNKVQEIVLKKLRSTTNLYFSIFQYHTSREFFWK